MGYSRGPKWPAPAAYFESGPIGFVYMLQIWFRYYFKEFIALVDCPIGSAREADHFLAGLYIVRSRLDAIFAAFRHIFVGACRSASNMIPPVLARILPGRQIRATASSMGITFTQHNQVAPGNRRYRNGYRSMTAKSLHAQLEKLDQEISDLDSRRSALIHRMSNSPSRNHNSPKVLQFPAGVTVRRYPHVHSGRRQQLRRVRCSGSRSGASHGNGRMAILSLLPDEEDAPACADLRPGAHQPGEQTGPRHCAGSSFLFRKTECCLKYWTGFCQGGKPEFEPGNAARFYDATCTPPLLLRRPDGLKAVLIIWP